MQPDQFIQLQKALEERLEKSVTITMEKNFNGKMRDLSKKVDDYIDADTRWKERDLEWKTAAQPSVTLGTNAINFWNVLKWFLISGATFAGFIMAVQTIKEVIKR